MSIWGKIVGGVAGFAMGGPLGALAGTVGGHFVGKAIADKDNQYGWGGEPGKYAAGPGNHGKANAEERQVVFTMAMIALSAKMAKADGLVTADEIQAFKRIFSIPPNEEHTVSRLYDQARQSADGFEVYAKQVADMFADDPDMLEEILTGLFIIGAADGAVHPSEVRFLHKVADIFKLDDDRFARAKASAEQDSAEDPYKVLGLSHNATAHDIKTTYRRLAKEHHPDTLIARGLPPEMAESANRKLAAINAAYDQIARERGIT